MNHYIDEIESILSDLENDDNFELIYEISQLIESYVNEISRQQSILIQTYGE